MAPVLAAAPELAASLGATLPPVLGGAALAALLGAAVEPDPLQAATNRAAASASPPRRFDVSSVTGLILHAEGDGARPWRSMQSLTWATVGRLRQRAVSGVLRRG
jgi:hypothetical protein